MVLIGFNIEEWTIAGFSPRGYGVASPAGEVITFPVDLPAGGSLRLRLRAGISIDSLASQALRRTYGSQPQTYLEVFEAVLPYGMDLFGNPVEVLPMADGSKGIGSWRYTTDSVTTRQVTLRVQTARRHTFKWVLRYEGP